MHFSNFTYSHTKLPFKKNISHWDISFIVNLLVCRWTCLARCMMHSAWPVCCIGISGGTCDAAWGGTVSCLASRACFAIVRVTRSGHAHFGFRWCSVYPFQCGLQRHADPYSESIHRAILFRMNYLFPLVEPWILFAESRPKWSRRVAMYSHELSGLQCECSRLESFISAVIRKLKRVSPA